MYDWTTEPIHREALIDYAEDRDSLAIDFSTFWLIDEGPYCGLWIARWMADQGRYTDALKATQHGCAPPDAQLVTFRAVLLAALGRADEAEALIEVHRTKALATDPNRMVWLPNLRAAPHNTGAYEHAKAALAWCRGNYASTVELSKAAIELHSCTPEVWGLCIAGMLAMNDLETAGCMLARSDSLPCLKGEYPKIILQDSQWSFLKGECVDAEKAVMWYERIAGRTAESLCMRMALAAKRNDAETRDALLAELSTHGRFDAKHLTTICLFPPAIVDAAFSALP